MSTTPTPVATSSSANPLTMAPTHSAVLGAGVQHPDSTPDLLSNIRRLIADAQQRSEWNSDDRLKRSVAYLWAAADALEGLPGNLFD